MSQVKTITIPDIGGADNVDVIEVHVAIGDTIAIDDALITLEGDKATMDIPSPHAGKVTAMSVAVGDKVSEGAEILQVELVNGAAAEPEVATQAPEPVTEKPTSEGRVETITIPDLSGAEQVDVIEIHVASGDEVAFEDALITLEGDKATMDIPSPKAGVIESVDIKLGDKVSEGDAFITMKVTGGAALTSDPKPQQVEEVQKAKPESSPKPAPVKEKPTPAPVTQDYSGVHSGPAVRKMARVLGVDLTRVKPTGPHGRVLKEDVEDYVHSQLTDKQSGVSGSGKGLPEMPAVDFSKFGEIETVPLSKIKKLTGANMQRNWQLVPHVTQFDEADITDLEAFRKEQKALAESKGVKLTMMAFLIKAVIGALKTYPAFNASLDESGENLVLKKYFHIGIAVDTPDGLVVPVIRNADKLGLFECADELMKASQKAREKKLSPADMQGSCFTISSLGGIGGTAFTPIVNAPDVAILGVSRSAMKPVYIDGQFEPRLMLPLSLSYDHRVIDGVAAAKFTSTLATLLSDIRTLLL